MADVAVRINIYDNEMDDVDDMGYAEKLYEYNGASLLNEKLTLKYRRFEPFTEFQLAVFNINKKLFSSRILPYVAYSRIRRGHAKLLNGQPASRTEIDTDTRYGDKYETDDEDALLRDVLPYNGTDDVWTIDEDFAYLPAIPKSMSFGIMVLPSNIDSLYNLPIMMTNAYRNSVANGKEPKFLPGFGRSHKRPRTNDCRGGGGIVDTDDNVDDNGNLTTPTYEPWHTNFIDGTPCNSIPRISEVGTVNADVNNNDGDHEADNYSGRSVNSTSTNGGHFPGAGSLSGQRSKVTISSSSSGGVNSSRGGSNNSGNGGNNSGDGGNNRGDGGNNRGDGGNNRGDIHSSGGDNRSGDGDNRSGDNDSSSSGGGNSSSGGGNSSSSGGNSSGGSNSAEMKKKRIRGSGDNADNDDDDDDNEDVIGVPNIRNTGSSGDNDDDNSSSSEDEDHGPSIDDKITMKLLIDMIDGKNLTYEQIVPFARQIQLDSAIFQRLEYKMQLYTNTADSNAIATLIVGSLRNHFTGTAATRSNIITFVVAAAAFARLVQNSFDEVAFLESLRLLRDMVIAATPRT